MDVVALGGLFHVQHAQAALGTIQYAVVGSLTAHFCVEGGLIQHHQHAVLCLLVGGNGIGQGLFITQRHNSALVGQGVVTGKDGGLSLQCAEQILAPAGDVLLQTLSAGALLLLLHLCVEAVLVDLQTLLGGDLLGQIQREAEGIVQLEGVHAAQQLLVCLLQTVDHVVQDVHAGIDGAGKVCLLGADDLLDIGVMLAQLGVGGLAGLDDGLHQIHEEGVVDAQHPAVACSTAQQTAQHIAAALVGGQDAVRHHKGAAADMVGDDADGDIGLGVLLVGLACNVLHMVQHTLHGIHLEQIAHVLHHAGQTLQAHAGINVGACQTLVVTLAVGIELAEHEVPDLHIAVAVAAHAAGRLAAAVLGAAVKVDLGAGAARAGAVLPEVVLLTQTHHVVRGDANLLGPDIVGLVVLLIDRDVQTVLGDCHPLIAGQELPCPRDDLVFEVILEGEVAQHLKEGAVAGSDAHALDIRGADALLAGSHAVAGRLLLCQEPLLHGGHAAVDQQQAGVVLGYQGEAVQTQMTLAFKEAQVLFAQFIQTGPLHRSFSPQLSLAFVRRFYAVMAEGRHGEKTKNSPHPKRDEGCLCIKLRGTTQIAKDHLSPAAFGALTLRSVRFAFAGSSGVARNDPDRSTLQPWALSLDGGVCISDPIIAICHNFTFRKADIASLRVQLNYSIRKTFVNGFEQNLRHPDAVCTGYLAVLDGHGRVSCIPPISIFFIAHCITNRPISLYDHWVGFKVCCTVR